MKGGRCYLVGAGPGDPGLLTRRGEEALSIADVVVYDSLVNPELLELAPAEARRIYVGKRAGDHTLSQDEINALLVKEVGAGNQVVRLKGGDPLVFARGGEEIEAVDQAGFEFEVVPGVSSAMAVPAYAGVPLTHRSWASNVTFVTGHGQEGESRVNWEALARVGGTLVIFMGARNLRQNLGALMDHGMDPATPAIFIQWGTTQDQRSVAGTVADLADGVERAGLGSPAIVVIGETVRIREKLAWFEMRPLFGKRVVITRTQAQSGKISRLFRQAGAGVLEIPAIRIDFPENGLDRWPGAEKTDWMVFTSSNGVNGFFRRFLEKYDIRELRGIRFACVGPSTAEALEAYHLPVGFMPSSYRVAGLVEEWPDEVDGETVVYACGNLAASTLEEGLGRRGAEVVRMEVYRTEEVIDLEAESSRRLCEEGADWIVFCSPSAVHSYAEHQSAWPVEGLRYGSIGPATSEALKAAGFPVHAQPSVSTVENLVAEVVALTSRGETAL